MDTSGGTNCGARDACLETLQDAVDVAPNGSHVHVGSGFYDEEVVVNFPTYLVLAGGWDGNYTSRGRSAVTVSPTGVPGQATVRSFTIQNGSVRME